MKKVVKFYVGVKDMILSNYPQVFFFFNNYPQVLFVFDEFLFKNKKGKFLEICYWEFVFEWKVWKYPHKNGKDKKKKKRKKKKPNTGWCKWQRYIVKIETQNT